MHAPKSFRNTGFGLVYQFGTVAVQASKEEGFQTAFLLPKSRMRSTNYKSMSGCLVLEYFGHIHVSGGLERGCQRTICPQYTLSL